MSVHAALRGKGLKLLTSVAAVFVFSVKAAHAYIDPGTGSYVLQVIAAGLFAVVFTIGAFWQKIKNAVSAVFCKRDQH